MSKLFILLFLILSLIVLPAFAGPVPDTGQTKCYDNTVEIPCPQPGEPFMGRMHSVPAIPTPTLTLAMVLYRTMSRA